MRVAIVDYGLANLRSVVNALTCLDCNITMAETGRDLQDAAGIVLPGVGSFDSAMRALAERGHVEALTKRVREQGVGFLGICLGLQLLFEGSEEGAEAGLGWCRGRVRGFPRGTANPKVPHIGWNEVHRTSPSGILSAIHNGADFYFVHSYFAPLTQDTESVASGLTDYGQRFVSVIESENIVAIQPHPEKSQLTGMKFLEAVLQSWN